MSAYIVFTRHKTIDTKELELYLTEVEATLEGHDVRTLAAFGDSETIEGEPVEGLAILEFRTIEAIKRWYDSPAYKKIRHHRFNGAISTAVITAGIQ